MLTLDYPGALYSACGLTVLDTFINLPIIWFIKLCAIHTPNSWFIKSDTSLRDPFGERASTQGVGSV
jgi:hypothetical protein